MDDGQGGEVERMREGDVFGDVPPPDYEDVVGEGDLRDTKKERDGGDSFDLRNDEEEEGRGFLAAGADGDEIVGGERRESADVKMGFFERVRARKEAKRRAWMERRAERGGGRGGFGCRGGRRMHCMS